MCIFPTVFFVSCRLRTEHRGSRALLPRPPWKVNKGPILTEGSVTWDCKMTWQFGLWLSSQNCLLTVRIVTPVFLRSLWGRLESQSKLSTGDILTTPLICLKKRKQASSVNDNNVGAADALGVAQTRDRTPELGVVLFKESSHDVYRNVLRDEALTACLL